jgi:glycosyltransferase involved in cell wall biosynthesis
LRLDSLRASRLPVVLFVSHAFGGGVARHIADLESGIEGRAVALRLEPYGDRHVVLRCALPDQPDLWFDAERDWECLVAVLEGIGIDRIHFHHVHGLPPQVLDLPRLCGCPHMLTLHDYFPACPAYHLKDRSLRYCGGMADCGKCLEAAGSAWGLSIREWRARFGALLATAERVIAPTHAAAEKLRKYFPEVSTVVWPHPDEADRAVASPLRVLVPGAISVEKGLDILEACVRDAAARSLPLHFHVAGFLGRALPTWPDMPLTVSGQYDEGLLPRLLALERGDVAFFPAQCPETFSYTLSAVLATDMEVVATDLGAFPERLASRGNARIVPWASSPRDFNEALLAVASLPAASGLNRDVITVAEYGRRYVEGLERRGTRADLPPLDPRWLVEPMPDSPRSTMAWLFEDGVLAGKSSSIAELRRRAIEADSQLVALRDDLSETRRRLDACETRLRDAQSQVEHERGRAQADARAASEARLDLDQVRTSRSWRLTAPLRGLARRMRGR